MAERGVVPDDTRRGRIGFDESIYRAGKSPSQSAFPRRSRGHA